jgi:hypothetical protein
MSFSQFVKNLLVHETIRPTYYRVPTGHVDVAVDDTPLEPEQAYFSLRVSDMFLAHDRKLYKTRYPGLYAFSRFLAVSEYREAVSFSGPRELKGLSADMSRVIGRNYRVLGPIPYRGDEVEVLIGLLALEGEDLAERILNLMNCLASIAGGGKISVPLSMLDPMKGSLEELLGLSRTELCIGLHDRLGGGNSVAGPGVIPGYFVVANTPASRLNPSESWVREGQLLVGSAPADARPPQGFDYFLLSLERVNERPDWSSLDLVAPRLKSLSELVASSTSDKDINTEFALFKGAVLLSSDLIQRDRTRIILGMKNRIRETIKLRKEGLDDIQFLGDGSSSDEAISMFGDLDSVGRALPDSINKGLTNTELLDVGIQ